MIKTMILAEYGFTNYYHKYIIFEADDLTELLKDKIKVSDKDCYMLCSCYIDQKGLLSFNVLSIGSSYEKCTKGLKKTEMLAIFGADYVMELECKIINPTYEMIQKNKYFIELMEQNEDEDLMLTRFDDRLNDVRDLYFPDVVTVGFIEMPSIVELEVKITRFNGPFLEGKVIGVPDDIKDIHEDDLVRALPYYFEYSRLISVFTGNKLSKEAQKQYKKMMKLGKEAIFGFSKPILRS
jgi:hypothetical protein